MLIELDIFVFKIHIQFVENMLQVHQKYENLINETFKNDPLFLSALDKACASVINSKLCDGKTTCRSAELVKFMADLNSIATSSFFCIPRSPSITTVCSRNQNQLRVKLKRSCQKALLSSNISRTRTFIKSFIAECLQNGKRQRSSS